MQDVLAGAARRGAAGVPGGPSAPEGGALAAQPSLVNGRREAKQSGRHGQILELIKEMRVFY